MREQHYDIEYHTEAEPEADIEFVLYIFLFWLYFIIWNRLITQNLIFISDYFFELLSKLFLVFCFIIVLNWLKKRIMYLGLSGLKSVIKLHCFGQKLN